MIQPQGDSRRAESVYGRWLALPLGFAALVPVVPYGSKLVVPVLIAMLAGAIGRTALVQGGALARGPAGAVLVAFLCWALFSTLWSPLGAHGLLDNLRVVALSALGFVLVAAVAQLDEGRRRVVQSTAIAAVVLATLAYTVDILGNGMLGRLVTQVPEFGLNEYSQGSAMLAVLAWPVLLLWRARFPGRHVLPALFMVLLVYVLYRQPMFASFVAFCVGAGVFAIVLRWRSPMLCAAIPCIVVVAAIAVPLAHQQLTRLEPVAQFSQTLPSNWQHRFAISEYATEWAMKRPVLGHGYQAARRIGRDSPVIVIHVAPSTNVETIALPLHPHNAALQVWLELGLVGVFIALAFVATLGWRVSRPGGDAWFPAAALASIATFGAVSALSFGLWQKWWLATAWLTAVTFSLLAREAGFGYRGSGRSTRGGAPPSS